MNVSGEKFDVVADNTLNYLLDRIDEDLGDMMEVDLNGGILSIELEDGSEYIVSKNAPNNEIWLSSPISGASHFCLDENQENWVNTRTGEKLLDSLAYDLTKSADRPFAF